MQRVGAPVVWNFEDYTKELRRNKSQWARIDIWANQALGMQRHDVTYTCRKAMKGHMLRQRLPPERHLCVTSQGSHQYFLQVHGAHCDGKLDQRTTRVSESSCTCICQRHGQVHDSFHAIGDMMSEESERMGHATQ